MVKIVRTIELVSLTREKNSELFLNFNTFINVVKPKHRELVNKACNVKHNKNNNIDVYYSHLLKLEKLSRINKQKWQRKHTNYEYAAEYIYLE